MTEGLAEKEWSRGAEAAYDAMADVYDAFTAHHEFDLWLGEALPRLEAHGLTGNRLLDAACGTGKNFLEMTRRGWRVTGSDISAAMIAEARAKLDRDDDVTLAVADMRELPVFGEFDLVWALGDAVNYLLDEEELVAALSCLRANLAPTGRLIFDANALHAYRTFFAETATVDRGDCRLVWTGETDPAAGPNVVARASFAVEPTAPGGPEAPPTPHLERHHPEATITAALDAAGLRVLDVYGHHYDAVLHQPLDESRDMKAVYIAAPAL
jgi:SAM-dependent methyltransferase